MKKMYIFKIVAISISLLFLSCNKETSDIPDDDSGPISLEDEGLPYSRKDWMKDVQNTLTLAEITIPGTHDAGADRHSAQVGWPEWHYVVGQDFHFINQMRLGVRWFDIRLEYDDGNLNLHHAKYDLKKQFHDILDWSIGYLNKWPSEVIILMVKQENSNVSDEEFGAAVYEKIKNHGLEYFYLEDNVPKLEDARGKVYIVRRFVNHTKNDFGIYFNWPNNTTDSHQAFGGIDLYAQDHYSLHSVSTDTKFNEVENYVEKAHNGHNPNTFFINFVSGERVPEETLYETTNKINYRVNDFLAAKGVNYNYCGVIMINFAGGSDGSPRGASMNLVKQILCRNDGVSY